MWTAKKFYITHCNRSPVSANNNTPLPQPTNSIFSHACKQNCVIATCIKWARRIDSNDGYTQRNINFYQLVNLLYTSPCPEKKCLRYDFVLTNCSFFIEYWKVIIHQVRSSTHRIERAYRGALDILFIYLHGKDNSCKASR